MSPLDINNVEKEIDPCTFTALHDEDYPVCILGFQIRNHYDQLRLLIEKQFKPVDVLHFSHFPETMPCFFRGIKLNTKGEKIQNIIDDIMSNASIVFDGYSVSPYKKLIEKYGLSCENNFSFLKSGVYPIDSECLKEITDDDINLQALYESIFKNKNVPFYQAAGYFTIFILDNRNIANRTNNSAIKKIIETYKNTAALT